MSRRDDVRALTRAQIFATARDIVEADGAGAVTIRRVASQIGYTAPVVYQHFADKAAVLDAVLTDSFERLSARMKNALAEAGPDDAIECIAGAYMHFARQNRRLYLFMNGMSGVELDPASRQLAALPVVEITRQAISTFASSHEVELSGTDDECETIWGLLNGMTGLGFLDHIGFERAWRLTVPALDALTSGWHMPRRNA